MSKKILLVDDELSILNLLEQTLEDLEEDYVEILSAHDGEEAWEIIQKEVPDLIFLDIMMPKANGYDVCQKIRSNPQLKSIYVILLTAKGQQTDREKGQEVGANEYITKPFDPDEILEKTKKILNI